MKIRNRLKMSAVMMSLLALVCCHDHDDTDDFALKETSVVGEWYEDNSTEDTRLLTITNYHEDGTLSSRFELVNYQYNIIDNYNGTYTFDGSHISENLEELSAYLYDVNYLDKYTLILHESETTTMGIHHRIIATYEMKVGDIRPFEISDDEFVANKYSSNDNKIAKINTNGIITAVKRGTAYVKAESSIGTAIIRVVVTDPNNEIDDYVSFLGERLDVARKVYGSNFFEGTLDDGTNVRSYNLADDMIERVVFYYGSNHLISSVYVILRDGTDMYEVAGFLERKYDYSNALGESRMYKSVKNEREVWILWNPEDRMVSYQFRPVKNATSYEELDGLIYMTVEQAAEKLNYELTEEDWGDGMFSVSVNNEVFANVVFSFDETTHETQMVRLRCKDGLSRDDVEGWYRDHYCSTGDDEYPYGNEETIYASNVLIKFAEVRGRTYVYYVKF